MSHETQRDFMLNMLSEKINYINEQLIGIQAEITENEESKEAVLYDISYQKSERDEAQMEADRLFEYARDCIGEYRDFAASYRADAMTFVERVRDMKECLADSYDELEGIKEALCELNEKRKLLKTEKSSLIRQHKDRVRQLREQNALNWREKPCAVCGRTLRYNVTWKHIPNICPECKDEFRSKRESKKK